MTTNSKIEANKRQVWSEGDRFTPFRYAQFARHFDKHTAKVLDCGCNTGRGGKVLKELVPNLTLYGMDLLEDRVKRIPANIYDNLFFGSAASIPLKDNILDAVVAGEVVEHIPDDELTLVFKEYRRVLKKGGLVLLTTPNPHSIQIRLGKTKVFEDPSHVNIMEPKTLRKKLEDQSFQVEKIVGSGRATKYAGEWFPLLDLYGSYLVIARK